MKLLFLKLAVGSAGGAVLCGMMAFSGEPRDRLFFVTAATVCAGLFPVILWLFKRYMEAERYLGALERGGGRVTDTAPFHSERSGDIGTRAPAGSPNARAEPALRLPQSGPMRGRGQDPAKAPAFVQTSSEMVDDSDVSVHAGGAQGADAFAARYVFFEGPLAAPPVGNPHSPMMLQAVSRLRSALAVAFGADHPQAACTGCSSVTGLREDAFSHWEYLLPANPRSVAALLAAGGFSWSAAAIALARRQSVSDQAVAEIRARMERAIVEEREREFAMFKSVAKFLPYLTRTVLLPPTDTLANLVPVEVLSRPKKWRQLWR